MTLNDFTTANANEYGEVFGLIGLIPNTPAYQLITPAHCFTIGYTDEGEDGACWVCQIDEIEDGYIGGCEACYQGATPEEALENAAAEACIIEDDAAAAAFAMLNEGRTASTDEERQQLDRLTAAAEKIHKQYRRETMSAEEIQAEFNNPWLIW